MTLTKKQKKFHVSLMTVTGFFALILAIYFYTDGHHLFFNKSEIALFKMENLEAGMRSQQVEYSVYLIKTFFNKLFNF